MSASQSETLNQRIARGPVSIKEALEIARQVAANLEKSHENGIAHGSLSPGKVSVSAEGRVSIAEFGVVPAEPKSDIRSFGSLLYELLTGSPAAEPPDWQRLPSATPRRIRLLLERCLSKDPSRRMQDIGDALLEINETIQEIAPSRTKAPQPRSSREKIFAAMALIFFLSAAWFATRLIFGSASPAASSEISVSSGEAAGPPSVRFDVVPPYNPISNNRFAPGFFLSPDGQKIAFVTLGAQAAGVPPRIWVRSLNSSAAEGIARTTNPLIAWSADSKFIAHISERKLKKVSASGGSADDVCDVPEDIAGIAWGAGNVILIGQRTGPLLRVSADGGKPEPLTELDAQRKETGHALPVFLPDGTHYLYVALGLAGGSPSFSTFVGELGNKERHSLPGIASEAKYLNGHLLFIQDTTLMAQPFDLKRLALSGEPFPVASSFLTEPFPTGPFSVSSTGTLAFTQRSRASIRRNESQLVWFDDKGSRGKAGGPPGEYDDPELSPDGKFAAFSRIDSTGSGRDIWILDIEKGSTTRLTSDPGDDFNPRWAPDSKRIAFSSARDGGINLYERAIDVVGSDKLLLKNDQSKSLMDWSPDGQYLVYFTAGDIWALPIGKTPIQITNTPFVEGGARISRDGRWIAFMSDEKGPSKPREIYIQSFPQPGLKKVVSEGGGAVPHWSRDSKQIFLLGSSSTVGSGSGALLSDMMMVAPVNTASSLEIGVPKPVFSIASANSNGGYTVWGNYNIAPDNRFLIPQNSPAATIQTTRQETGSTSGITVILNWNGNRR